MSLLTVFQNKTNTISDAKAITDAILEHRVAYENSNKWQRRCYKTTKSSSPLLSDIENVPVNKYSYIDDMNTYTDWQWDNSYIGYMQCYVICNKSQTLTCKFYTDDAGRFYLNGVDLGTSKTCTWTNVTIPFTKGVNRIQILFQEGSGGDGAAMDTKLSEQSFVDAMYANKYGDTTSL